MKLLKRKKAGIQDYINFAGIILFVWVLISKTVVVGTFSEMFVADNALALVCIGVLIEMLVVNLSVFITDFKNFLYSREQEKKYGKKRDSDEKEES